MMVITWLLPATFSIRTMFMGVSRRSCVKGMGKGNRVGSAQDGLDTLFVDALQGPGFEGLVRADPAEGALAVLLAVRAAGADLGTTAEAEVLAVGMADRPAARVGAEAQDAGGRRQTFLDPLERSGRTGDRSRFADGALAGGHARRNADGRSALANRRLADRDAQAVHLADHRAAADAAQLPRDLARAETLQPQLLEGRCAFFAPVHDLVFQPCPEPARSVGKGVRFMVNERQMVMCEPTVCDFTFRLENHIDIANCRRL